MSAPRFYCTPPLPLTTDAELPPEAAHHASRVLRLRTGDAVQIFDGVGNALDATIAAINGKHVMLGNLQTCMGQPESGLHIVLAQAMCSSDKMDWVVQKATELGAAEIVPVQTQRSVAKLSGRARREARRALAQRRRLRLRAMRTQYAAATASTARAGYVAERDAAHARQ